MTTLARTHPLPDTPGIRDLRLLTGPDAGDLLAAALQPAGGRLLSWRAVQVEHRSGRGVTAAYQVRIGWPGGHTSQERLGARTGPTPDAALVLQDGVDQVAVWRFPHDPYLPALGAAYDEASLARLLGQFGFGGPVRRQVRAYRPCRRAVIEATGGHGRLFVKVVRPNRVEALHRRHRLLVDAGLPTPPSLGYTPDGLLVLQALPGPTLRHILQHRGGPAPSAGDPGPARSVTGPAGRRSPPGRRGWTRPRTTRPCWPPPCVVAAPCG